MNARRNASIDFLRCLCMFFVVAGHILGHSDFLENMIEHNSVFYTSHLVASCVRVAVPVFVLITGYFGVKFSFKKVYNFEITMLFYGFLCLGIALLYDAQQIEWTLMSILKTILPFTYKSWWFATAYLVLLIFSPFINRLLENLSQKEHLTLLIVCFILFNVVSSYSLEPIDSTSGYSFMNFIFLYCVGRYIRKYDPFSLNKYVYLFGYIACSLIILVSYILYGNYKFGTYNSVLLFFASVFLFVFFKKTTIRFHLWSKFAPYTFAVYLISDNFFIRPIVDGGIFDPNHYSGTLLVVVYILLYALAVMIVCMGIDWVVKHLLGKVQEKLVMKLCDVTENVKNKMFGRIGLI